jgi:hypothetical protein
MPAVGAIDWKDAVMGGSAAANLAGTTLVGSTRPPLELRYHRQVLLCRILEEIVSQWFFSDWEK